MREHRRQLDAGVEASGPHDFAVRFRAVRPLAAKTSTASRPTFVTMANAPLIGRDGRICRRDLPDKLNEIFLRKRLDRPDIQPIDLPVGQISRRLASMSVVIGGHIIRNSEVAKLASACRVRETFGARAADEIPRVRYPFSRTTLVRNCHSIEQHLNSKPPSRCDSGSFLM
jgi:hypothetical protein